MSKHLPATAFALLLILTFTLSCSIIPKLISAPVPPVEIADTLMRALRDGNYAQALMIIENDDNKPAAGDIEKLKQKIESENLQPQSWTLGRNTFKTRAREAKTITTL